MLAAKTRILTVFLILGVTAPVFGQTKFDGKWRATIESSSADTLCNGFLFQDAIGIRGNRLSGSISHDQAGVMEISGSVSSDGTLKNVEANGSYSFVSLTGVLSGSTGSGKWFEERSSCEGTWNLFKK